MRGGGLGGGAAVERDGRVLVDRAREAHRAASRGVFQLVEIIVGGAAHGRVGLLAGAVAGGVVAVGVAMDRGAAGGPPR